jgi:hypothetical protein
MMYYSSPQSMLFMHFMVGVTLAVAAAVYAAKKERVRRLFTFGDGLLGTQKRWLQWYSWALTFEIIMSFIGYEHTQMLYFEIGMSIFQAGALVVGAFVIDRVAEFFTGDIDGFELPKPDLSKVKTTIKSTKEVIKDKINTAVDSAEKAHDAGIEAAQKTVRDKAKDTLDKFDKLTKGH